MPAQGTGSEEGLEHLHPLLRAAERKRKALRERLAWLKSDATDTRDSRNAMTANVDVSDELGLYNDKDERPGKEWTPENERGFIVRTRRDGLHTLRNTSDILQIIEKVEARQVRIERW